jgi:hypothetical protein
MLRKLVAALSSTQLLFMGSSIVPYLLMLVVPRSNAVWPTFVNLLALLVLLAAAVRLASRTAAARRTGKGLLYPVLGIAAVVGYFYSVDTLRQAGDYLGFVVRKPGLEAHLARVAQRARPSDSLGIRRPPRVAAEAGWRDAAPPEITYYTLDGQASVCFWGYAYSPQDQKPANGQFTYWHQLDGHWYMWFRFDN